MCSRFQSSRKQERNAIQNRRVNQGEKKKKDRMHKARSSASKQKEDRYENEISKVDLNSSQPSWIR